MSEAITTIRTILHGMPCPNTLTNRVQCYERQAGVRGANFDGQPGASSDTKGTRRPGALYNGDAHGKHGERIGRNCNNRVRAIQSRRRKERRERLSKETGRQASVAR